MEAYRKFFAFADGATLQQLLEREPDFPYDDEIVQIISGRTDLGDHSNALLNAFAKKKEDIEEQNDVFDFVVTHDNSFTEEEQKTLSDEEKAQTSDYFIEYFKKYNGYYVRRRYPLHAINSLMQRPSALPPRERFVAAVEECEPDLALYTKICDYSRATLSPLQQQLLLGGKCIALAANIPTLYYYNRNDSYNNCLSQKEIPRNKITLPRLVKKYAGDLPSCAPGYENSIYWRPSGSSYVLIENKFTLKIRLGFYLNVLVSSRFC